MVYILGAGGMAKETAMIYNDLGRFDEIEGFIEHNVNKNKFIYNKKVNDASIINKISKKSNFIGAIGSPLRKSWIENIERERFKFDTIIHPLANINENTQIEAGCIFNTGVTCNCDISIGKHSILNTGSILSHDVKVGNFVTIGPGTNIGGNVEIEDECWISIGVTIINSINIGKKSFIGAGAVVTNDIPDNVLALGIPARPVRKLNEQDWDRL